jgi:serine/threonine protein kinase
MIRDKQAVHRRLQEYGAKSTADSSPNTDTYSLVHSEPLIEEDDLYNDQVSVKIVDFGVGISSSLIIPNASAAWTDHKFSETIQSIGLRAPEVVLGLNWGTPVDIWSAASLVSLPAFRFAI